MIQQLNSHIASVTSKPLPSPTSEVKPVDPPVEEEKTTESTTTSTVKTSTTPAPGTAKTETNGASVKTEADKTKDKTKKSLIFPQAKQKRTVGRKITSVRLSFFV